ncbi:MAG TPA: hypothetical protein VFH22_05050, partial [Rhodocyclaceae bacterium]|nr:hypothetical protein [Rhodocyclaceae bacterium]
MAGTFLLCLRRLWILRVLFSVPDARAFFLLSRQEKEAKEKATPPPRRFGDAKPVPCAAHRAGRLRNSALRASD